MIIQHIPTIYLQWYCIHGYHYINGHSATQLSLGWTILIQLGYLTQ